jgi:branched-chain amino acid aminotransferase
MTYPWTDDQLADATRELIDRNGLHNGAYVRPVVLRGMGAAGVDPMGSPVHVYIVVWEWGAYLGPEALEKGVAAGVSSWFRPAPNTHPTMAKAGGNYLNSSLMKIEAHNNGFDEAIALSVDGVVSEGSGQNIFLVKGGEIHTPQIDGTFLQGITRDSVMRIAEDLGIPVREGRIPRESLYVADEIFFVGTASEVTPVRSVDHWQIGNGKRGPVTTRIQDHFLAVVRGEAPDRHGWLTSAEVARTAGAARVGKAGVGA